MSTQKPSRSRVSHRAAPRRAASHRPSSAHALHRDSFLDAFSGTTALSIILFAVATVIALLAWNAYANGVFGI